MTATLVAATMILALGQAASRDITLQGCVTPGLDKGTYLVSPISHVVGRDGGEIPEVAHGRRVFFWLDSDGELGKHIGHMVEIKGTFAKIEESEVELKAGKHKDGGLIVEFEVPGKDVRVPEAATDVRVGTAGRATPEKNDIKSDLLHVDVTNVKLMGSCTQ